MSTLIFKAEYRAFHDAKNRCTNPKHKRYADWGGRGIKFNFDSVGTFISYLGVKPTKDHQLDRIDNDGHYEMGNVKWSTRKEQQLNKRPRKSNPFNLARIRKVKSQGLITDTYQAYCSEDGKFKQLYVGPNLDEAKAARIHWNNHKDMEF